MYVLLLLHIENRSKQHSNLIMRI